VASRLSRPFAVRAPIGASTISRLIDPTINEIAVILHMV
jgi:hypothetical protein